MKVTRWWSPGLGVLAVAGFFYFITSLNPLVDFAYAKIDPMGSSSGPSRASLAFVPVIERERLKEVIVRSEKSESANTGMNVTEEKSRPKARLLSNF